VLETKIIGTDVQLANTVKSCNKHTNYGPVYAHNMIAKLSAAAV